MARNLQNAIDTSRTEHFTRLTIGYRDETVDLHERSLDVVRSSGGEGSSGQVERGLRLPDRCIVSAPAQVSETRLSMDGQVSI